MVIITYTKTRNIINNLPVKVIQFYIGWQFGDEIVKYWEPDFAPIGSNKIYVPLCSQNAEPKSPSWFNVITPVYTRKKA